MGLVVRHTWICILLVTVAACFGKANELATGADGIADGGSPGQALACMVDDDCVLVSAKCCECPTFATRKDDPIARACDGLDCPTTTCSETVQAACDPATFQCVVACQPLACNQTCENGYAADMFGCLSCECAPPVAAGCTRDTDCVQTRADCCGCVAGGFDTAVLASDAQKYDQDLMCPASPACPGVNTCNPGDAPRCVQGQCALTAEVVPADACGRPDLAACPAGTTCVVNASDPANLYGVGICVAQ